MGVIPATQEDSPQTRETDDGLGALGNIHLRDSCRCQRSGKGLVDGQGVQTGLDRISSSRWRAQMVRLIFNKVGVPRRIAIDPIDDARIRDYHQEFSLPCSPYIGLHSFL